MSRHYRALSSMIAGALVAIGLLAVPVGAQQPPACSASVPFPDAVKIGAPNASAPDSTGAWLGAFEGVWEGDVTTRLVVERLDGSKAHIVWAWGDEPGGGFKAGFRRFTADLLADGSIQWGPANDRFILRVSGDVVNGQLTRRAHVFRATLQRCAVTMSAEPPDVTSPPGAGASVLDAPLTVTGLVREFRCPTGRSSGELVGDGFLLKVTGSCQQGQSSANAGTGQLPGLRVADGEVRLEYKAVTGRDRLRLRLGFRVQPDPSNGIGYAVRVEPGRGAIDLVKQTAPDQGFTIAERDDLGTRLATDNWVAIAVRGHGPNLWVLVNDEPVISAYDAAFDAGGVMFAAIRLGNVNDASETAVVLRNLRVSPLAEGDPTRAPTYVLP